MICDECRYWVQYTDPATGVVSRVIAVPGARYEGVEDGRGGFGAFQYQAVMSQYGTCALIAAMSTVHMILMLGMALVK